MAGEFARSRMVRSLGYPLAPFGVSCFAAAMLAAGCGPSEPADALARAEAAYASGQYRLAYIDVRNVLRDEPGNADARLLLGRASLALNDPETAVWELSRALDLGKRAQDVALPLAAALSRLGRGEEALAELERWPDQERDAEWFVGQGEVFLGMGGLDAARDSFQRALAADAEHYRGLVGLASVALRRQDWEEAHELAERAVALEAERAEAYSARGRAQLATRNAAAAERDLTRAADLFAGRGRVTPEEIDNLLALAEVQLNLGRLEALDATATRVAARMPNTPVAHYIAGAAQYGRGRLREADWALRQALALAPDEPRVRLLLGAVNLARSNFGQAERHLQFVRTRYPDDVAAVRLLVEIRRRAGRAEAALAGLQDAPAVETDPDLMALRGVLHLEAGQTTRGAELLERAARVRPGDVSLLLHLSRAYLALGREAEAASLFEGVLGEEAIGALEVSLELLFGAGAEGVEAARARADSRVAAEARDVSTLMGAALFRHAIGDADDALALLDRAVEADPNAINARVVLAAMTVGRGDAAAAREQYLEATKLAPQDFRAWLGLARIAALRGALDEAERLALRAVEAAPNAMPPRLLVAHLALEAGDLDEAAAAIARARALDDTHADVESLAALLAMQRDETDAAIEHLRRAADADPARAHRWHALGRAEREAGRLEAARLSLQRAESLAPADGQIRLERALMERALGNTGAAVRLAQAFKADFPMAPEGYLLEGELIAGDGRFAEAAALFGQAFVLRPAFEPALLEYRARRAGDLPNPDAPLRAWIEVAPRDSRAWLLLAELHHQEGNNEEAVDAYERIIDFEPDNVTALNNAAWLAAEADDERALEYARRAYELASDAAPVLDTYGWVLVRQGEAEAGLPYLRDAARRAPEAPDISYHLAYALAQTGRHSEARSILDGLLNEFEHFSYRQAAEALMSELL